MKFNFPIAEQLRKKKKSTFNDHKKLGYKSLTGLSVSVCQIMLSFVIVNICQYTKLENVSVGGLH